MSQTPASEPRLTPIAEHVWRTRYRGPDERTADATPAATFARVAQAVAAAEGAEAGRWAEAFRPMLADGRFLPGGRILAGAGTGRRLTLFNCFVLGTIGDSLDGIFGALHEGALTMQEGGGVGYDFSTLRPRGMRARATGGVASGPVSFMGLWDRMCETLETANNRRGAMMATLRCDHPDVDEFVDAKRAGKTLSNFNLSVQITDEFLQAARDDGEHLLVFPEAGPGRRPAAASLPATPCCAPGPARRSRCPAGCCARVPARAAVAAAAGVGGHQRRAGLPVRRSDQPRQQPLVPRAHHRHQPVRRGAAATLRRLQPGLAQPGGVRARSLHAARAALELDRLAATAGAGGALPRRRHRRVPLPAAGPGARPRAAPGGSAWG